MRWSASDRRCPRGSKVGSGFVRNIAGATSDPSDQSLKCDLRLTIYNAGANRAAPEIASKLGNYPELGRRAARTIPNATLVAFPELGHSPQVESPAQFHNALLRGLGAADGAR